MCLLVPLCPFLSKLTSCYFRPDLSLSPTGILRVAAFSGAKDRPLHIPPANPAQDSVPPAEQGEGYNGSAVAHFHSKCAHCRFLRRIFAENLPFYRLLKIKDDRLWTDMARSEASRRQSMVNLTSFCNRCIASLTHFSPSRSARCNLSSLSSTWNGLLPIKVLSSACCRNE